MFKFVKRRVTRRCPDLVVAYHAYRQSQAMRRHGTRRTPYGFHFSGHKGMQDGTFEPEECAVLQRHLENASVFVDVGANAGFYVCLARGMGKHVIAVEPQGRNLDCLYSNLAANGWSDVEVFPVGLGEQPGLTTLYGGGTSASLIARWAGNSEIWRQPVPISTLDVLLNGRFRDHRIVIKVDVEGAEYDVLRGASKTLARSPKPVWLIEICLTEHHPAGVNPHFDEVFRAFWASGYTARTIGTDSRVVSSGDIERWARNRKRDFGHVSYVFEKAGTQAG